MKKYIIFLFYFLFSSCLKDNGTYEYDYGNEVSIRFEKYYYSIKVGDTLSVYPIRQFKYPHSDTLNFEHIWYRNTDVYSDKNTLTFIGDSIGSFNMTYYMKDKNTDIMFPARSGFTINVEPLYNMGWIILYEKNDASEIAMIIPKDTIFTHYTELYKTNNKGEKLGSSPVFIKDYAVTWQTRGLLVVQRGGQGCVELNSDNYKKEILLKDEFIGGPPDNLDPVDAAFLEKTHFLLMEDGRIYRKYIINYGDTPWITPWNNNPEEIEGGMKIEDIWDSWSLKSYFALMYDALNKRILEFNPSGSSPAGQTPIAPISKPTNAYPSKYYKLDSLGNIDYIWGGTFNDTYYYMAGAMLIKDLDDGKFYFQDFTYSTDYYNPALEIGRCIEFTGGNLLSFASKFAAIKERNYLFFSGGTNNCELHYFDIITKNHPTLYKKFEAPITALYSSNDGNTIAVGLENGSVYLFDISHDVIISGKSKELYHLHGLGKIIDIVLKKGNIS